jgi:predicted phage terminase large subunit-like protein
MTATTTDPRLELARRVAMTGPIGMAEVCSRGTYTAARHHLLLEREVLNAIDTGGRVIISVAVRSGKTQLVSRWTPAWFLARHPDRRVIVASHEADFAGSHGRFARDRIEEWGPSLFGTAVDSRSHSASRWDTDQGGGMVCVGVGGAPIGRGADLMVIDDPHPNFAKAMSDNHRSDVKDWWTGTLRSRLQPGAAVIVVCSRWHEDDLPGFLLREFADDWTEVRIPALCDDPEHDPLGRAEGEALWPEAGWTEEEYTKARRETTARYGELVWLAQFQQRPSAPQGNLFRADRWTWCAPDEVPDGLRWVRAWDLAATAGGGDWTAGVKLAVAPDDRVIVADVVRGQWAPDQVKAMIAATRDADGPGVRIAMPRDPGQAGVAQFQELARLLKGSVVVEAPQTGSKEVRAWPLASQQRAGNVTVVRSHWSSAFTAELEAFPTGRHDDQVDAAASAFNLAAERRPGLRVR